MLRRSFLVAAPFVWRWGRASSAERTSRKPELYFYPAPYRLATGEIMYTPFAVDEASFASAFPQIAEMAGLVVMPYWSQVSPRPGVHDLTLIDHALSYWGARGKTVVAGVITVGFPLRARRGERVGATPEWLMRQIDTYEQDCDFIGTVRPIEPARTRFRFPSYWDPRFLAAQARMIASLARFDGHPALSRVRIGTGVTAEDNPTFDGLRNAMPGFSNRAWIDYSRTIFRLYKAAFRRTPLEFDLDRMGWIRASGTPGEQRAADAFVAELNRDGVFLAMNGLDTPNALDWLNQGQSGTTRSIDYLVQRRRQGRPVGLEGASLDNLGQADLQTQARVFDAVGASRMVLFSDAASALDFVRSGANPRNATGRELFGEARLRVTAARAETFFRDIGVIGA
jgi:hypothetical protein